MKKRYNFISRLINKITLNSQSNNDSFSYYGHWVELQSGTVDYMSVTIYNTSDRYSGTLVEFQFDFWTMELCFDAVSCDEIYDTVVKAFKGVYYNRRIRVIEYLNSATHIVRNKFKILSNNILPSILPCQKIHLT